MWFVVSIFNPLMAFLALTIVPIPEVSIHETNLLSHMGQISGGNWLASLVSIDAVIVLSGVISLVWGLFPGSLLAWTEVTVRMFH